MYSQRGFTILSLFADLQCTGMLKSQGLLTQGYEILSPDLMWFFQQKCAKQAILSPKQRQKLIQFRLRAVLVGKLLCKQSWQHFPIRIPPHVLRHLMTMGIPRQMIVSPVTIQKRPFITLFSFSDKTRSLYHPSGYEYRYTSWTDSSACGFVNMTVHPCQTFMAITGSNGGVWIGKVGCPNDSFYLCHKEENPGVDHVTCAFHPFRNIIAIGVRGYVLIYEISSSSLSLSCRLLMKRPFFQDPGYFCTMPPTYAPTVLYWDPNGESLIAISNERGNLSRKYQLDWKKSEFKAESMYNYLCSITKGQFAPTCSCISSDGTLEVSGYSGGELLIKKTPNLDSESAKILKLLQTHETSITKIEINPIDPSILVISTKSSGFQNAVHLLELSIDGTIKIIHSFPNTKSFCFYDGMLILQYGDMITAYNLNRDNFPVQMGEFSSEVGYIQSFCFTTLNDVVTLWYSTTSNSKLHKAKLTFK
jgi:hypothetical protein